MQANVSTKYQAEVIIVTPHESRRVQNLGAFRFKSVAKLIARYGAFKAARSPLLKVTYRVSQIDAWSYAN